MKTFLFALAMLAAAPAFSQNAKYDSLYRADSADFANANKRNSIKDNREKQTYVLYIGGNLNTLSVPNLYGTSTTDAGYDFGFSYRTKNFIYWQLGIQLYSAAYDLTPGGMDPDSVNGSFSVASLQVPVTVGINILKATDRVVNLRGFLSAYPSFVLGVDNNEAGFKKDDMNPTGFYGQIGIGVDVMFLVIEVGYNHGFTDLFKDMESKPDQAFLNVGFRF